MLLTHQLNNSVSRKHVFLDFFLCKTRSNYPTLCEDIV